MLGTLSDNLNPHETSFVELDMRGEIIFKVPHGNSKYPKLV